MRYDKFPIKSSSQAVIEGKEELRRLKNDIALALGDSEYNRKELEGDYGFAVTGVLPAIVDFDKFNRDEADEGIIKRYGNGSTNLLFVSKIAPNKCQEDIIKVFYLYQKYLNPDSRLFLVGSTYGMEVYERYLKQLTSRLGLEEKVIFAGQVYQGYHMFPFSLLFLVFTPFGNIFAYNATIILSFILAGTFMYLLTKFYTGNRVAAFFSALIFTLAPFRLSQIFSGHLNGFIFFFPLIIYLFEVSIKKTRLIYAILAGLSIFSLSLMEFHLTYYLFVWLFSAILSFFLRRDNCLHRQWKLVY